MKYTSDIKKVKEWGIVKSVLYNFVLSIFITLALSVITIYALGLRLDVVLSDSMTPVFYTDDIVIVKPYDDYKVGDIIEYRTNEFSTPITHRIVEKIGSGKTATFLTKGDAVQSADLTSIKYSQINGKVISVITDGNLMYQFVKSNYFIFIDILLGVWVLTTVLTGEIEMRKHNIAKA